jgi:hypothetical protein
MSGQIIAALRAVDGALTIRLAYRVDLWVTAEERY